MLDLLYIEDNADDADIFGRVVRKMERMITYKVIESSSEAIDYLTNPRRYLDGSAPLPKLVLLDLNMTGFNGFDIIQQTRAASHTRYVPIVVFSTSDRPGDITRSLELGANAYVIKPGGYHSSGQLLRRLCDFWLIDNATIF